MTKIKQVARKDPHYCLRGYEFARWVGRYENDSVGLTNDPMKNPIARYLKARTGDQYFVSPTHTTRVDNDTQEVVHYPNPVWAIEFMNSLQKSEFKTVSGNKARKVFAYSTSYYG